MTKYLLTDVTTFKANRQIFNDQALSCQFCYINSTILPGTDWKSLVIEVSEDIAWNELKAAAIIGMIEQQEASYNGTYELYFAYSSKIDVAELVESIKPVLKRCQSVTNLNPVPNPLRKPARKQEKMPQAKKEEQRPIDLTISSDKYGKELKKLGIKDLETAKSFPYMEEMEVTEFGKKAIYFLAKKISNEDIAIVTGIDIDTIRSIIDHTNNDPAPVKPRATKKIARQKSEQSEEKTQDMYDYTIEELLNYDRNALLKVKGTGNFIKDAKRNIGSSLDEHDESLLREALANCSNYEESFLGYLAKNGFTKIEKIQNLKYIFDAFHQIRKR